MPKINLFFIAVLLLLGVTTIGFAQKRNLAFNHINHNNGLSETMNAYVYKDSKGFVWISSNDGVNRFDGKTVVQYRSDIDANSPKGKIINSNFFEDDESNIWFCTYDAINCYQRKTDKFKSYQIKNKENKTVDVDYYGFNLDVKNRLWIIVAGELYLFNIKTTDAINAGPLTGNRCFVKNSNGNYIVYAFYYGQSAINKFLLANNKLKRISFFEKSNSEISFKNIYALHFASDTLIWLGCNNGLVKINTTTEKVTIFNRFNNADVIEVRGLAANSKNIFVASSNGLLIFDKKQDCFIDRINSETSNPYSLAVNTLNDLYLDYENILWVSMWNKGIDYSNINKSYFQLILNQNETGIENSKVDYHAIANDNTGNYWFATDHGITVTDKNFNRIKNFTASENKNSLRSNRLIYLMHDSIDSKMWICSIGGGVEYYDEKTKQFNHVETIEKQSKNAYYILKLKNGRFLASSDDGLNEIIKTKTGFKLIKNDQVTLMETYSLYETSDSLLLVSYHEKYIVVFKITPNGLLFLKQLDIASTATVFYQDPVTKLVWITTGNGLVQLNTSNLEFNFVKNINGIEHEYLYAMQPDGANLWISSGKGIVRLNTKTLASRIYNAYDGIAILDFWDFCSYKLSDNRLMFGGSGGINIFNPADVYLDTMSAQPQLTSLKVNDQFFKLPVSLNQLNELHLDYNQNTFSFEFADLHLSNTGHNHFQYRIDELDSNWVENGTNNFARFAQLNHGNYTFKVRAANADGIWSQPIVLAIQIRPPWYKTWWAYTLDVLLAAGLIVWLTLSYSKEKLRKQRIIIEKQQAVEVERTRISAEMHDDLGASLSTMKMMCDLVKTKLEGSDSTEEIDFIAHTSNDLVYKMREIIWSMNSKYDSLDDLINYIERYAKDYLTTCNMNYEFTEPEVIPELTLQGEMRRNIFLVVKETLHNTFKHSKAETVSINFMILNENSKTNTLKIIIHDNGVGINLDAIHRFGNGLDNMRKRMESVGGTYSIANQNGTSTTLTVVLERTVA